MSNKFTGLDNINKPAFDASKRSITKVVKEIQTALESKANVWVFDEFIENGEFDDLPELIRAGDIIVDYERPFTGFVQYINYENKNLYVVGFSDELAPYFFYLTNTEWREEQLKIGTKLYKHTIWNYSGGDEFWFVSTERTPIQNNNFQDLVDKINKTSLYGYCHMLDSGNYGSSIKFNTAYIISNNIHIIGFSTTGEENNDYFPNSLVFIDTVTDL